MNVTATGEMVRVQQKVLPHVAIDSIGVAMFHGCSKVAGDPSSIVWWCLNLLSHYPSEAVDASTILLYRSI